MNTKALLVLAVVLVFLIGAYFAVKPSRPGIQTSVDSALKIGNRIQEAFRGDRAWAVEIQEGALKIRLERIVGNQWVVASREKRKVNPERIGKLLRAIQEARLVQRRLGPLSKFELDAARRTRLAAFGKDGGALLEWLVGKAPAWNRCFLQLPGHDGILEIDQDLDSAVGHRIEGERRVLKVAPWYDLTILRFDAKAVIDIAIKKGHAVHRVQRVWPGKGPVKPGEWPPKKEAKPGAAKNGGAKGKTKNEPIWWITEPEGAPAEENVVRSLCATAAYLFAKGYADDLPPAQLGLDPPSAETRIVLGDGRAHTLVFGKVSKDYVILKLKGRPEIWKINKYSYEALTKPLAELRKEEKKKKSGGAEASGKKPPKAGAERRAPVGKEGGASGTEEKKKSGTAKPKPPAPGVPSRVKTAPAPLRPPAQIRPSGAGK